MGGGSKRGGMTEERGMEKKAKIEIVKTERNQTAQNTSMRRKNLRDPGEKNNTDGRSTGMKEHR